MHINPIHINTIGLIFDIAGAWLVAWEVVRKFNGQKYEQSPYLHDADKPPYDSKEYKKWERKKYKFMWLGLTCLTIGFGLQIGSNYLINNSKNIAVHPVISETMPTHKPPQNSSVEPILSPITKAIEPTKNKDINTK